MTRLWRDRGGAMGVILAGALPMLVGLAALAVDLGTVALDARRLQGIADAAALAAASQGEDAARALVTASWPRRTSVALSSGRVDTSLPFDRRFVAGSGDATRVELRARTPTFFASIFGITDVSIARAAVARRRQEAAFSLGSRLVGLDNQVLNALLAGLGVRSPGLSLLDYRGLVDTPIDVFRVLGELKLRGAVSAGTYGAQLATEVPLATLFDAMAATLGGAEEGAVASTLRRLAAAAPARSIRLDALIDAGPLARADSGGSARVPAMTLLTAMLQTGGPRQVALDLGAGLPGLASTRAWLAIGEGAQRSPLVAVSATGEPVLRTAQARLYLRARLAPTLLPGLSSLASLELPILVELAGAQARLKSLSCPPQARSVTLEGKIDPATVTLGSVDETKLNDFATPLTPQPAKLLDTLLVDVTGSSRLSLGAAEPWRALTFGGAAIDAGTPQTITAATPVGGVAASLVGQARLEVKLLGLPMPVDPLLRTVGTLLGGVAPALDGLLANLTGVIGLGLGEADLAVTHLRCNGATLVG